METSRCEFLKGVGVAAAGGAVGFPAVVSAQARRGIPSDPVKINVMPIRARVAPSLGGRAGCRRTQRSCE